MSTIGKKRKYAGKTARVMPTQFKRSTNYGRWGPLKIAKIMGSAGRTQSYAKEQKNIDTTSTGQFTFGTSTSAAPILLNGIVNGTTAETRLGRRFTMKSLYARFAIHLPTASTGASPLRVLIVYDRQTNAATPAVTDILTANAITAPMNLGNARRFETLLDERISCLGAAGPASAEFVRYVRMNHQVECNDVDGGTVGDIQTGAVWMMAWQDGGILVASPVSSMVIRIRFLDD